MSPDLCGPCRTIHLTPQHQFGRVERRGKAIQHSCCIGKREWRGQGRAGEGQCGQNAVCILMCGGGRDDRKQKPATVNAVKWIVLFGFVVCLCVLLVANAVLTSVDH